MGKFALYTIGFALLACVPAILLAEMFSGSGDVTGFTDEQEATKMAIRSSQSSFALLGGAGGSLSGSAADVDSSGGWSACSTSSKIFCWRLEPYSARISSKV